MIINSSANGEVLEPLHAVESFEDLNKERPRVKKRYNHGHNH
jgi:hypothetical protein